MNKILRRSIYYLISLIVFLLLSSVAILLLNTSYRLQALFGEQPESSQVGEQFPDFMLKNHTGSWTTLEDLGETKYVLIDFWFSGCKPCIKEMKGFSKILDEHGSDLKIISISVDPFEHMQSIVNSKPKPWDFLENNRPDWIFLTASKKGAVELIEVLNVQQYPTYFILNENRRIIDRPISAAIGIDELNTLGFSTKIFPSIWNKYSTDDKIKFYRAIFILFNLLLLITLLITYSIKWVASWREQH